MLQHEAGRAAYEDAKRQLNDIHGNIETKTASLENIQSELEKSKLQVLEKRKVEQACFLDLFYACFTGCLIVFAVIGCDEKIMICRIALKSKMH